MAVVMAMLLGANSSVYPSGAATSVADHAGRAWPVIDEKLLAQAITELLRDQPRYEVGAAAGRRRNDDADRLGRIIGGERRTGHDQSGEQRQQAFH